MIVSRATKVFNTFPTLSDINYVIDKFMLLDQGGIYKKFGVVEYYIQDINKNKFILTITINISVITYIYIILNYYPMLFINLWKQEGFLYSVSYIKYLFKTINKLNKRKKA